MQPVFVAIPMVWGFPILCQLKGPSQNDSARYGCYYNTSSTALLRLQTDDLTKYRSRRSLFGLHDAHPDGEVLSQADPAGIRTCCCSRLDSGKREVYLS